MVPLIECVPNFSEGRRLDVMAQIVEAIQSVRDVCLLDCSSNYDHNRSVITFVGAPQVVEEAAFRAIARAAELIDLERHTGEHPRLGATDVVPFVPIRGATMEDCVAVARQLGQRVGDELHIPVYLYEAAATRPERQDLANIRRGEYEGLKASIENDPDRLPDFGPKTLGKAGATVIGARPFLIAYNVYLNSADVEVAKKIARAIRYSSGGFRFVKSLGLQVEGLAQVSMNLTDFTQTPIYRVQETIRREAERYGTTIKFSEVVGLIPQRALSDSARWYLQLDGLREEQVLENRLQGVPSATTPNHFVTAVAKPEPTPGAGAVAALAGALGAALAEMVAGVTKTKAQYEAIAPEMEEIVRKSAEIRDRLVKEVEEDSAVFNAVLWARRLPKGNEEERSARAAAIQSSLIRAAEVPFGVASHAFTALELAERLVEHGDVVAISDAAGAAYMARAAIECAALVVRANVMHLEDQTLVSAWLARLKEILTQTEIVVIHIQKMLDERSPLTSPSSLSSA